jgi:hypothetical protein
MKPCPSLLSGRSFREASQGRENQSTSLDFADFRKQNRIWEKNELNGIYGGRKPEKYDYKEERLPNWGRGDPRVIDWLLNYASILGNCIRLGKEQIKRNTQTISGVHTKNSLCLCQTKWKDFLMQKTLIQSSEYSSKREPNSSDKGKS